MSQFHTGLLRGSSNPRAVYSSKAVGEPALGLASSVYYAIKVVTSSSRDRASVFRKQCGAVGRMPGPPPPSFWRYRPLPRGSGWPVSTGGGQWSLWREGQVVCRFVDSVAPLPWLSQRVIEQARDDWQATRQCLRRVSKRCATLVGPCRGLVDGCSPDLQAL